MMMMDVGTLLHSVRTGGRRTTINIFLTFYFVLCSAQVGHAGNDHWGYTNNYGNSGVDKWCNVEQSCCGVRQSPIDIETEVAVRAEFRPLEFQSYEKVGSMTATNNGHTIVYKFKDDQVKPKITHGGLSGTYVFDSLHLHFGSKDSKGSEHTFNNKSYPVEMHLVHYNQKYKNVGDAIKNTDGLAVLGIMFHVSSSGSNFMDWMAKAASHCPLPKDEVPVDKPLSLRVLLPKDVDSFYRYDGSLTTPGCSEVVTWTVFQSRVPITDSQLASFRKARSGHETNQTEDMADNFRPPQPINARTVYVRTAASGELRSASPTLLALIPMMIATILFSTNNNNYC